jgi:hypothetical protein
LSRRTTTFEDLWLCMSEPGFAADNHGYALASDLSRTTRRSLSAVLPALRMGEDRGVFASREHPTRVNPATGDPLLEYKAVTAFAHAP